MALGYRSVLRLDDDDDAVKIATDQMRTWLKSKHPLHGRGTLETFDWDGVGVHRLGASAELTVVEHSGEDASFRRMLKFVESNSSGIWRVTVTATSLPNGNEARQLIVVEVNNDGVISDGRNASDTTDPPRIVRDLLDVARARDFHADLQMSSSPTVVDIHDVPAMLEALMDERRGISLVIAGAMPLIPISSWRSLIGKLVKNSVGTTASYVLTEEAHGALNHALSDSHKVDNGAVRTFLPGVAPGDRADAYRHRILTPTSLAEALREGNRIRPSLVRVHAASARRRLLEQPLPHQAQRSARILEREELKLLSEDVPSGPTSNKVEPAQSAEPPTTAQVRKPDDFSAKEPSLGPFNAAVVPLEADATHELEQLVLALTGSSQISPSSIRLIRDKFASNASAIARHATQVDGLLDRLNASKDELAQLQSSEESLILELAVEAEQRRAADRLSQYRGDRLKDLQVYDGLHDPDGGDLDRSPGSVQDLLDRLEIDERVSEFIRFTGDLDTAVDIDIRDGVGRYAAAFWEYILVMRDYCHEKRDRGFSGNLYMYLTQDDTKGRKCDPKRFAPTESDTVQSKPEWRDERRRPVPVDVNAAGFVHMMAHFKPTHKDSIAPRMHIYDDSAGPTGKMYIGYIGRHLSNTKTN